MFSLGNTFGRRTAKPVVEPSQVEPAGSLVGARLTLSRVVKAYDTKLAELTEAHARLVQRQREEGQKDADGEDVTSATLAVQDEAATVKRLDSAVAVLLQRKQDAERAVTNAERAAKEDAKVAALARLKAVGVKVDQLLVALEHLVNEELMPGIDEVRLAAGNQNFIIVLQLEFERLLLYAVRRLVPKGNVADRNLKYDKWSDAIPDPESARTRSRDESH